MYLLKIINDYLLFFNFLKQICHNFMQAAIERFRSKLIRLHIAICNPYIFILKTVSYKKERRKWSLDR